MFIHFSASSGSQNKDLMKMLIMCYKHTPHLLALHQAASWYSELTPLSVRSGLDLDLNFLVATGTTNGIFSLKLKTFLVCQVHAENASE